MILIVFFITLGAIVYECITHTFSLISIAALFVGFGVYLYTPNKKNMLRAIIISSALLLGAVYMAATQKDVPSALYTKRTVRGTILAVDKRLDSTRFVLLDRAHSLRIQVFTQNSASVLPGDMIEFHSTVEKPSDFLTATGVIFPYENYLLSKHIVATSFAKEIIQKEKGGIGFMRAMTQLRHFLAKQMETVIDFPYSGIVSAMLFGYQGGITEEMELLFQKTGALHVLVLSGYNITMLATIVLVMTKFFSRPVRLLCTISAIIVLVSISGAGIPAVRAGSMGGIAALAQTLLKKYQALQAMMVTFLILFILSPRSVLYDPGLHLSFLATYSILFVVPKTSRWIHNETLRTAVVMPLVMLPYMFTINPSFSFSTVIANIIFAYAVPVIMVAGIVALVVSFIPMISVVVGVSISSVLQLLIDTLAYIARLPSYESSPLPRTVVLLFYGVLFIALFRTSLQPQTSSPEKENH